MALTEKKELFEKLELALNHHLIQEIYEPDPAELLPDCYMAAVDLFRPGQTYKVFFKIDENGHVDVWHIERWRFG